MNPPDFESYSCTLVKGDIDEDFTCDRWYPSHVEKARPKKQPQPLTSQAITQIIAAAGPVIAAALAGALAQIAALIALWWAGSLMITRAELINEIRQIIISFLTPALRKVWASAWRAGDKTAGGLFEAWFASHGESIIAMIADTRLDRLMAAIDAARRDGAGPDGIIDQLAKILDTKNRANLIAITEVARAAGEAWIQAMMRLGIGYKQWITKNDARVCKKCLTNQAAGVVPITALYADGSLTPPAHPRCRCILLPIAFPAISKGLHPGERDITCERGHVHHGEFGAAGLLVRCKGEDGKTRYLLQKRSPDEDDPGTWSLPGGALLENESIIPGAFREAEEEMGEMPPSVQPHHHVIDDHGNWAFHTIVCDVPEMFAPSVDGETPDETAGWGWFTKEEIKDLPLHPGFAEAWPTVLRSRRDTTIGKCLMRRVDLNGQEFIGTIDPCPCLEAAGSGSRLPPGETADWTKLPHDVNDLWISNAGRTAAPPPSGGSASVGETGSAPVPRTSIAPRGGDDSAEPSHRGVPPHREGMLQGYAAGYWPEHEVYQPQSPVTAIGGQNSRAPQVGKYDNTLAIPLHGSDQADMVYDQLAENFPVEALDWVHEGAWAGPLMVKLPMIDWHDMESWSAFHEQDRVRHFERLIQRGEHFNPVVMVRVPGRKRFRIVDGHHRAMAYKALGKPVRAWVGVIPQRAVLPAEETHSSQEHQGASPQNA